MRSDAAETREGWTRLLLTAAGAVAVAASLVAGALTTQLRAQAPASYEEDHQYWNDGYRKDRGKRNCESLRVRQRAKHPPFLRLQ